jgi:hypothetical protein
VLLSAALFSAVSPSARLLCQAEPAAGMEVASKNRKSNWGRHHFIQRLMDTWRLQRLMNGAIKMTYIYT